MSTDPTQRQGPVPPAEEEPDAAPPTVQAPAQASGRGWQEPATAAVPRVAGHPAAASTAPARQARRPPRRGACAGADSPARTGPPAGIGPPARIGTAQAGAGPDRAQLGGPAHPVGAAGPADDVRPDAAHAVGTPAQQQRPAPEPTQLAPAQPPPRQQPPPQPTQRWQQPRGRRIRRTPRPRSGRPRSRSSRRRPRERRQPRAPSQGQQWSPGQPPAHLPYSPRRRAAGPDGAGAAQAPRAALGHGPVRGHRDPDPARDRRPGGPGGDGEPVRRPVPEAGVPGQAVGDDRGLPVPHPAGWQGLQQG